MSKQWYAAYRPYGVTALNTNGPRADVLVRFDNKAERDAWVAADDQRREPMSATANELRAALRFEQREQIAVIHTTDEWAAR
jgi:hypothetical protein